MFRFIRVEATSKEFLITNLGFGSSTKLLIQLCVQNGKITSTLALKIHAMKTTNLKPRTAIIGWLTQRAWLFKSGHIIPDVTIHLKRNIWQGRVIEKQTSCSESRQQHSQKLQRPFGPRESRSNIAQWKAATSFILERWAVNQLVLFAWNWFQHVQNLVLNEPLAGDIHIVGGLSWSWNQIVPFSRCDKIKPFLQTVTK